jgi:hypothetical protein
VEPGTGRGTAPTGTGTGTGAEPSTQPGTEPTTLPDPDSDGIDEGFDSDSSSISPETSGGASAVIVLVQAPPTDEPGTLDQGPGPSEMNIDTTSGADAGMDGGVIPTEKFDAGVSDIIDAGNELAPETEDAGVSSTLP